MLQKHVDKFWHLKLLGLLSPVVIGGAIAVLGKPTFAQILPDSSLGVERSIVKSVIVNGVARDQIEGGAVRGINLFHSFRDFNISEGQSLYFQNPAGIENIVSRVTGGMPSNIQGTLGVSGGIANLFLINPSGIIFGGNAHLEVGGSFVATTANAIQFGTQGFFSSSDPNPPSLLTVNPSAFWFNQIAHAPIVNRSIALSELGVKGLQVPDGRSLLLLGGEIDLARGSINASGGRVELGGVAGAGTIRLSLNGADLHLSFPANVDRANISLTNGATINTSGEGGGPIQIWGRQVLVSGGSQVVAFTQGTKGGGELIVDASQSVELLGFSPFGSLSTLTFGDGKAGDLTINTQRLILQDGAQVVSGTLSNGAAGQLIVNASESVELTGLGGDSFLVTGLGSFTSGRGNAGNLTINTTRLIIRDVAVLSTQSQLKFENGQFSPASGQGGNLTVNASESVELTREGFVFTDTQGSGSAGNLTINTNRMVVQDRSEISARSQGLGDAGNITVRTRSTTLKNQSSINAVTRASQGGNITLQVQDLLLLRQGSSISTTAGTDQAGGNGGNITINAPKGFLVTAPNENNDITANAFNGRGGNITINAQGIYWFTPRSRADLEQSLGTTDSTQLDPSLLLTNDITAISQGNPNLNGNVTLNTPDIDPSRGLVKLPVDLTDVSRLIVQTCPTGDGIAKQPNEFIITGRGGLPPTPSEAVNRDAIQVDLVTADAGDRPSVSRNESNQNRPPLPPESPIVEAQGWQVATNGTVFLVAATPQNIMAPSLNRLIHCR